MFQPIDATFRVCILVLTEPEPAGKTVPERSYWRGLTRAVAVADQGSSGQGCLG